jgi:hypothetical protein
VNNIARWDGSHWNSLTTCVNGTVKAMCTYDNDGSGTNTPALFVAGRFTVSAATGGTAFNIAKWTGAAWQSLGTGLTNSQGSIDVYHMTVHDDGSGPALYVSGMFNTAGGVAVNRIARWNGSAWSSVGNGIAAQTFAMCSFDPDADGPIPARLFAGGSFSSGNSPGNHIVQWDGTSWTDVGGGCNNDVLALEVFDDGTGPALYAGGEFTTAGGAPANRLARWNGSAWSALGSGTPAIVRDFAVGDDGSGRMLFAAGDGNLLRWSGSSWTQLGVNLIGSVATVAAIDDGTVCGHDAVYLAGGLVGAGEFQVGKIARWTGDSWSPMGFAPNNIVNALLTADLDQDGPLPPRLYIGGRFDAAGPERARSIATWDGGEFAPLGTGLTSTLTQGPGCLALTLHDADGAGEGNPSLIAGGDFTHAGGSPALRVAVWDGMSWSPLGPGFDQGTVNAVCSFDPGTGVQLFAAGTFTSSGGNSVQRIARWTGAAWAPLGSGLSNTGRALAVFDDGTGPALFAAGDFTIAGDVQTSARVAKWDGTGWRPLLENHPPSVGHASAFDAARSEVVLFGGTGPALSSETWTWSTGQWTRRAITGPSPRSGHAMAYDPARQVVILFGGQDANGLCADTWTWNGTNWTSVGVPGPSARRDHRMAFDSAHATLVMFGGSDGAALSDTWLWDGTSWSQASPVNTPPARHGHAMAYSGASGCGVIVHGGQDASMYADTWRWDGADWAMVAQNSSAPACRDHAIVCKPSTGELFMFGGSNGTSRYNTIYQFLPAAGNVWADTTSGGVTSRSGHSLTYDAARDVMVLFGGTSGAIDLVDTYEYATAWTALSNAPVGPRHALLPAVLGSTSVLLAGGSGGVRAWDGSRWSQLGSGLTNVYALTFSGGSLYAVGSFTTGGTRNVARWTGATWQAIDGPRDYPAYAAAPFDDDGAGLTPEALYVGGDFTVAAALPSDHLARYGCPPVSGISLGSQPQDATVGAGSTAVFEVDAYAAGTPVFQWRRNGTPLTDGVGGGFGGGAAYSGTHADRLVVSGVTPSDAGTFDLVVTCQCDIALTMPATLLVIGCGTSDFNGDSDFGTDADIEAFFACLAGACCPACWSGGSDFNGDGDFGTDQDIEAFFRVLAGGGC